MSTQPRNADESRARILDAARRLFAEQGLEVSLREIAASAGVSHGLIRRYFGSREQMVAAIIRHEIDTVMAAHPVAAEGGVAPIREMLREGVDAFRDFARIISRAELAGIAPERMLDPSATTPAMRLADLIAALQAKTGRTDRPPLDPRLVSAFVNAALFGFATLSPWLMASVGLRPNDYEARTDEIADIVLALIERAGGQPPRPTQEP